MPSIVFQPRQKAIHRQIAESVRDKINSGEIPSGTRLPSTQALAKSWKTHVEAVHMALTQLAKEGLLERSKKGTRVRQIGNRLSTIGVYSSSDIWATDLKEADYCRHVYRNFQEILAENNIKERVFLDVRPADEQTSPCPLLEKAVNEREIQTLMVLTMGKRHEKWLPRQPIPMTGLGAPISSNVNYDMKQFIEAGVESLVGKGCRSIGMFGPFEKANPEFYNHFRLTAKKAGVKVRSEWIPVPSEWIRNHEQYGYEQFRLLWKQTQRPDGMLVFTDVMAKGVVTAVLQEKVRVPEDLCLALHRHREIGYLCPFPVTFIESSCRIVAEKLWEQIQHQLKGEKPKAVQLKFSQVENYEHSRNS